MPIDQVSEWHELFSTSPGLLAITFLAIGFGLREIIEIFQILTAALRKFLLGERRKDK